MKKEFEALSQSENFFVESPKISFIETREKDLIKNAEICKASTAE